jgi:ribonuclease HI
MLMQFLCKRNTFAFATLLHKQIIHTQKSTNKVPFSQLYCYCTPFAFAILLQLQIYAIVIILHYEMSSKKQKWYTVWKGREVGVFSSREACKNAIHGFAWAQYKSYPSKLEAEAALQRLYTGEVTKKNSSSHANASLLQLVESNIIDNKSICVDAACSSNPWVLERRGVDTMSWSVLFHSDIHQLGTTNVGEWLALIDGMQWLVTNRKTSWTLYSDSRIALWRVSQSTIRTQLPRNMKTEALWRLVDNQLEWLQKNTTRFVLKKRKTSERWEIPADFGRK